MEVKNDNTNTTQCPEGRCDKKDKKNKNEPKPHPGVLMRFPSSPQVIVDWTEFLAKYGDPLLPKKKRKPAPRDQQKNFILPKGVRIYRQKSHVKTPHGKQVTRALTVAYLFDPKTNQVAYGASGWHLTPDKKGMSFKECHRNLVVTAMKRLYSAPIQLKWDQETSEELLLGEKLNRVERLLRRACFDYGMRRRGPRRQLTLSDMIPDEDIPLPHPLPKILCIIRNLMEEKEREMAAPDMEENVKKELEIFLSPEEEAEKEPQHAAPPHQEETDAKVPQKPEQQFNHLM